MFFFSSFFLTIKKRLHRLGVKLGAFYVRVHYYDARVRFFFTVNRRTRLGQTVQIPRFQNLTIRTHRKKLTKKTPINLVWKWYVYKGIRKN